MQGDRPNPTRQPADLTQLIEQAGSGSAQARTDLLEAVAGELRTIAASLLRRESDAHTLNATAARQRVLPAPLPNRRAHPRALLRAPARLLPRRLHRNAPHPHRPRPRPRPPPSARPLTPSAAAST
ncbi:MAG: hypothetical protein HND58_11755 [Planctomycetota bacterium]|nr:MAG: hypothetical protein HND58_11755 [Planctomycetota bacterium]